MAALHDLLWLTTRHGFRADLALDLIRRFGSAEAVYYGDRTDYEPLPLSPQLKASLLEKSMDPVERVLADCDRLGLQILTCQDAQYPERLLQLPDHPLVLYVRGRLFRFDEELAIGMVGARNCSEYGRRMAGRLAFDLTRAGALVLSGMAQGIDGQSLKAALQAGGPVVSVLAGGVDVVYPRQHRWLYEDVAAAGALISEAPPGTPPEGWRFPIRNRIISGLSVGVVAVEAARNSGTLITVDRALEQDRDVFAVPGPADAPMSTGTNWLISKGYAKLVRGAGDILEEYTLRFPRAAGPQRAMGEREVQARLAVEHTPAPERKAREHPPKQQQECAEAEQPPVPSTAPAEGPAEKPEADPEVLASLADQEKEILNLLFDTRLTADELVGRTEIPARRVNSALTVLQVRGLIQEYPGRRFEAVVRFAQV